MKSGDPFEWLENPEAAEAEQDYVQLGDLKALRIQPGDVIVIKADNPLEMNRRLSRLRSQPEFKDIKFLVFNHSTEVGVFRKDNSVTEAKIMVESVLRWAESNPKFKTDFVKSIKNRIDRDLSVSERQFVALTRIITRYGIPVRESFTHSKKDLWAEEVKERRSLTFMGEMEDALGEDDEDDEDDEFGVF